MSFLVQPDRVEITEKDLLFYQPGDLLERYKPGETISRENRSWPFLFIAIDSMELRYELSPDAKFYIADKLRPYFRKNGFYYIGDLATRAPESFLEGRKGGLSSTERKYLQDMLETYGLCHDLKVREGWRFSPSDKITRAIFERLPVPPHLQKYHGYKKSLRDYVAAFKPV